MTHYQNTTFIKRVGISPLEEQVYSILDSRIQFIDYQVQSYFNTHTSSTSPSSNEEFSYSGPSSANNLVSNLDQILSYTEKLQNDLKLLQVLRSWLKEETARDVLDLLTNNKYLNYSEETLEHLLKKKALFYYSLRVNQHQLSS